MAHEGEPRNINKYYLKAAAIGTVTGLGASQVGVQVAETALNRQPNVEIFIAGLTVAAVGYVVGVRNAWEAGKK